MSGRSPTAAVLFAHRGARANAPENTIEAFVLALRLGATGLESDAWLTADGTVVLDHDGVVGRLRRRPIATVRDGDLPSHIPSLAELYRTCGSDFELSLDVKDPEAARPIVGEARSAGGEDRLWLCHPDWQVVASWRADTSARLVDSTRVASITEGLERRAARLREAGVDAINLHQSDWSGGRVALVHRFGLHALGWDAQVPRVIADLLEMGLDGVFSDHVSRMVDVAAGRIELI